MRPGPPAPTLPVDDAAGWVRVHRDIGEIPVGRSDDEWDRVPVPVVRAAVGPARDVRPGDELRARPLERDARVVAAYD